MPRLKRNPRALRLPPEQLTIVRVGKRGTRTHVFSPPLADILCQSGKNAGRIGWDQDHEQTVAARRSRKVKRELHPVSAREANRGPFRPGVPGGLTCYRCIKLAESNMAEGRAPWDPGRSR